jgi:uncharacterized iron-regulated protein
MWLRRSRCLVVLTLACVPGVVRGVAQARISLEAIDLDATLSLDRLAMQLATKRVVFIGETHDRYDHHLTQLEIIRRLHQIDPDLAIGVEYFQQPFQPQVDDYIAGRTNESEFLRGAEYFQGWGYDYRMYAPIFRFAREQHIPVRALNVPTALPSAIFKSGIAGLVTASRVDVKLSEQQRAYLPKEIVPADEDYRSRLRTAFAAHGPAKPDAFDHFVEAQLVWDEGMAESAAAYLTANPGRRMVILAGSGHMAFGSGIPKRLERRTHATYSIVLNSGENVEPHMADYLVLGKKEELPPAGVLGVTLEEKCGFEEKSGSEENNGCRIRLLSPDGAAEKAGLKKGEVLLEVDGQPIHGIADLRVALWDKKPGDRVRLSVRQKPRAGTTRSYAIELTAPAKPAGKS